jgi:mannose-1-phosphate guanylyltransferase
MGDAVYVVILAGGGGTRLWPLSDPACPKPFLPLLGAESLLQGTVRRLEPLVPRSRMTIVTARPYASLAAGQVPGVAVLAEPEGRNTAAAVALAAWAIDERADEVMIVVPADHTIGDEAGYRAVLRTAASVLAPGALGVERPLVTLGVRPTGPATTFGYLRPRLQDGATLGGLAAFPLEAFEEKPGPDRAAALVATPGVAWNAGIFLWTRAAIQDALLRYAPDIAEPIGAAVGDEAALEEAYRAVRATSIDYAVMEPAGKEGRVLMAALDVGWNDLGTWSALLAALGVAGEGRVVQPGERASVGPDDLVIRRVDGRLVLEDGPATVVPDRPTALLYGAAAGRSQLEALLQRVGTVEETR